MIYCKTCNKIYMQVVRIEDIDKVLVTLQRLTRDTKGYNLESIKIVKDNEDMYDGHYDCPKCYENGGGNTEPYIGLAYTVDPPEDLNTAYTTIKEMVTNKEEEYVDLSKLTTEQLLTVNKSIEILRRYY